MLARSSSINTRLSALETYVDMPKEHRGMTITGRQDAQHTLLLALREDQLALREDQLALREDLRALRADVDRRFSEVDVTLGKVLYGMVEIKNLLTARTDSP